MNFMQDQCQVRLLGRNNPHATTQAGADWWGSSYTEKDLGVFGDTTLTMSQQSIITAKVANSPFGLYCQQVEGGDPSPLLSPADTTFGYCIQFSAPNTRETGTHRSKSSNGPPRCSGHCSI